KLTAKTGIASTTTSSITVEGVDSANVATETSQAKSVSIEVDTSFTPQASILPINGNFEIEENEPVEIAGTGAINIQLTNTNFSKDISYSWEAKHTGGDMIDIVYVDNIDRLRINNIPAYTGIDSQDKLIVTLNVRDAAGRVTSVSQEFTILPDAQGLVSATEKFKGLTVDQAKSVVAYSRGFDLGWGGKVKMYLLHSTGKYSRIDGSSATGDVNSITAGFKIPVNHPDGNDYTKKIIAHFKLDEDSRYSLFVFDNQKLGYLYDWSTTFQLEGDNGTVVDNIDTELLNHNVLPRVKLKDVVAISRRHADDKDLLFFYNNGTYNIFTPGVGFAFENNHNVVDDFPNISKSRVTKIAAASLTQNKDKLAIFFNDGTYQELPSLAINITSATVATDKVTLKAIVSNDSNYAYSWSITGEKIQGISIAPSHSPKDQVATNHNTFVGDRHKRFIAKVVVTDNNSGQKTIAYKQYIVNDNIAVFYTLEDNHSYKYNPKLPPIFINGNINNKLIARYGADQDMIEYFNLVDLTKRLNSDDVNQEITKKYGHNYNFIDSNSYYTYVLQQGIGDTNGVFEYKEVSLTTKKPSGFYNPDITRTIGYIEAIPPTDSNAVWKISKTDKYGKYISKTDLYRLLNMHPKIEYYLYDGSHQYVVELPNPNKLKEGVTLIVNRNSMYGVAVKYSSENGLTDSKIEKGNKKQFVVSTGENGKYWKMDDYNG
ncbi:hypothetical protein L3V82_11470, partial [Thiotrichales bacterium 19S3-7]|nr:hypothetical protein [Thiotrichales bacterium 19S3-7]